MSGEGGEEVEKGGEADSHHIGDVIDSVLTMARAPRPPSPPPTKRPRRNIKIPTAHGQPTVKELLKFAGLGAAGAAGNNAARRKRRKWQKVDFSALNEKEEDYGDGPIDQELEVLCDQTEIRDCIVRGMMERDDESMTSIEMLDVISPLVEFDDVDTKRRKIEGAIKEILVETEPGKWELDRALFIFDIDLFGGVRVTRRIQPEDKIESENEEDEDEEEMKEEKKEETGEDGRVIKVEIEEGGEINLEVDEEEEWDGEEQGMVDSPSDGQKKRKKREGVRRTSLEDPEAEKLRRKSMRKSHGHGARVKGYALIRQAREAEMNAEEEEEVDDPRTARVIRILAGDKFSKWTFKRISTEYTRSAIMGKTTRKRVDVPPEIPELLSKVLVNSRNLLWIDNCKNESWSLNRDHFSFFARSDGSVRIECVKERTYKRRGKNERELTAVEGEEWIIGGGGGMKKEEDDSMFVDSTTQITEEPL